MKVVGGLKVGLEKNCKKWYVLQGVKNTFASHKKGCD